MFKFNIFKSHSSYDIQQNEKILDEFRQLDAEHKKQLIKKLSSRERIVLLKTIKNNGQVYLSNENRNSLREQIKKTTNLTIPITRRDDTRSPITSFMKRISNFAANVAYFFNFLTSYKANELIKRALIKLEPKADNKPCVSSEVLKRLVTEERSKAQLGEKVNLANILQDNGFSKELNGQTFSSDFSLKDMNIEGVTFSNCKFDWTPCSNSNLKDVTFKNCDIYNLSLMNSSLENCLFYDCNTREVMFTGAKLDRVAFHTSTLISGSFEDASLDNCLFSKSALPGTHFLEAEIRESKIIKSNLKDTVFFGTAKQFKMDPASEETAKVTRPTTAILIHPEARGISTPKAYMKLDQTADTIPIRITMQAQKVTKDGVNNEVELALKEVGSYDRSKAPIPQRLIAKLAKDPDSESSRILQKAEKLASQVDSLFLPGGEDVSPALYGQEKAEQTDWGGDYRRSILELGLIHQSFTKGVPLMAVCRGFQMSNVYFGAQLVQHVEGHEGIQNFKLSTPEKRGLYAKAMKNNIVGACFHHQAVSEETLATEHLETSVLYKGLVKAAELDKAGATPMVLLQFHPEFYKAETADSMTRELVDRGLKIKLSKENEAFWDILSDSAKVHRAKKETLKIIGENTLSKREAALEELEGKRAKVFEAYKKDHFDWQKWLLDTVKNAPEKLLERYLTTNDFPEEREALVAALLYDENFLKSLMDKKNGEIILKTIQQADSKLFEELKKKLRNKDH